MTPAPWFCEAHRLWTTSDCPKCDDDLDALSRLTPADVIRQQPIRRPGMDLRPKKDR